MGTQCKTDKRAEPIKRSMRFFLLNKTYKISRVHLQKTGVRQWVLPPACWVLEFLDKPGAGNEHRLSLWFVQIQPRSSSASSSLGELTWDAGVLLGVSLGPSTEYLLYSLSLSTINHGKSGYWHSKHRHLKWAEALSRDVSPSYKKME